MVGVMDRHSVGFSMTNRVGGHGDNLGFEQQQSWSKGSGLSAVFISLAAERGWEMVESCACY
jgi:hypothetical protein